VCGRQKQRDTPLLLESLLLKGAIVTIDAMGCQRGIATHIVDAGADYVLACKGNQGSMLKRVQVALKAIDRVPLAYYTSEYQEVEKGHGRIEIRRCVVSDILARKQYERNLWLALRSIVMVKFTREIGTTVTMSRASHPLRHASSCSACPMGHRKWCALDTRHGFRRESV